MLLPVLTQIRIVARLLACEQGIDINLDQLAPPWRDYAEWCVAGQVDESPAERWQGFFRAYSNRSEEHLINCKRLQNAIQFPDEVAPALDVLDNLPDQVWLWPGWIARQQFTVLAGVPGAGKSYLALDIAHRIVAGATWPDGLDIEQGGTVLYLDAEDRPALFKTRMIPWPDDDRRHLYYIRPRPDDFMFNVDYPEHRDRLEHWVYSTRPRLIIVDSYGSLTLRGENNKEEVQQTLRFFTKLAYDYDTGVLLLHHLRKRPNLQLSLPGMQQMTQDMVRGSGHITAMATNLIGMQTVQISPIFDPNGPREIQMVKSNAGSYPDPIGLSFRSWEQNPEVAILSYTDAPQAYHKPSKIENCAEWLVALLETGGSQTMASVLEQAEVHGYTRSTVYRARKTLGDRIVDTSGARVKGNRWALDGQVEEDQSEGTE